MFKQQPPLVLITLFSLFSLFSISPLFAQGDLLITPRRVVFDGNKKSQELNLANAGKDTAKYQISIVQIRMKEDGAFETITEPDSGQYFAQPYLRYFPRSVTLAPNQAQTIKVQLINTHQLKPGEYRSHFYFRAIPNMKPLGEKDTRKDTTSFSVTLTPVFGITIPVIIRVGEPDVKMTLSDVSLEMINDTTPKIQVVITRSGNMSVYGDLEVNHISSEGKLTQVGIAKGIAIYTPNYKRKFQLNLNNIPEVNYKSGKLKVAFILQQGSIPALKSEKEILLQ